MSANHAAPSPEKAKSCHDCGEPSNGTLYMHTQIGGFYLYVCSDCLEEANLMEEIYAEPCPECHGKGDTWEGWECEWCNRTGTVP